MAVNLPREPGGAKRTLVPPRTVPVASLSVDFLDTVRRGVAGYADAFAERHLIVLEETPRGPLPRAIRRSPAACHV